MRLIWMDYQASQRKRTQLLDQRILDAKERLHPWSGSGDATLVDDALDHLVAQVYVCAINRVENADRKALSTGAQCSTAGIDLFDGTATGHRKAHACGPVAMHDQKMIAHAVVIGLLWDFRLG